MTSQANASKLYRILLIDDEKNVHYSFKRIFQDEDIDFLSAHDGNQGLNMALKDNFDLILMDIRMPGIDGLTLLKRLNEQKPGSVIVIMTAHGTTETAIEAMKHGAFDYLTKPFDVAQLKQIISQGLEQSRVRLRSVGFGDDDDSDFSKDIIIGKSAKMQQVYKLIGQIAPKDVNVLITGESGTGKELVARAIYKHSLRREKPFLIVNAAAIPDNLLESEFFGHERGAFTGAVSTHIGKFEKANQGTLFLDEIGDLPLNLQAKLLRVIQDGEFERVGGSQTIKTSVRIIAATNKELKEEVRKGNFREDLLYRLNVITIELPPLRDHKEDIPHLIDYFIKKYSYNHHKKISQISKEAMELLLQNPYKGNIRELENIINRSVILASGDTISIKDIQINEIKEESNPASKLEISELLEKLFDQILLLPERDRPDIFEIIEKTLIKKALDHTKNNQVKASQLLGISRNTLRNRVEKYELG